MMVPERLQLICESDANKFNAEVAKFIDSIYGKEHKLHFSTAYHPNGMITFSALIEVFKTAI